MDDHLQAPEIPDNKGVNVYCPVTKEFTAIYLGHSADGMEVYACGACKEPEPVIREVTEEELVALFDRLNRNE